MLGSSLISTSGAGGGGESFGYGGAAAQTPAAGAWSDFVDAAGRALGDTRADGRGQLSKALSMAARAYEVADQAVVARPPGQAMSWGGSGPLGVRREFGSEGGDETAGADPFADAIEFGFSSPRGRPTGEITSTRRGPACRGRLR